jgi:hypothetical protein
VGLGLGLGERGRWVRNFEIHGPHARAGKTGQHIGDMRERLNPARSAFAAPVGEVMSPSTSNLRRDCVGSLVSNYAFFSKIKIIKRPKREDLPGKPTGTDRQKWEHQKKLCDK